MISMNWSHQIMHGPIGKRVNDPSDSLPVFRRERITVRCYLVIADRYAEYGK